LRFAESGSVLTALLAILVAFATWCCRPARVSSASGQTAFDHRDLVGTWLAHPLPRRKLHSEEVPFDADHMLERCRLFLLIALARRS